MQHLSEQELILHHYHDGDSPARAEEHLASCDLCRKEFDSLRRVLAMVDELPVPERDAAYGEQVWSRLRWKLGSRRRMQTWQSLVAAAAVLAIAFFAGVLWHARNSAVGPATRTGTVAGAVNASSAQQGEDRILFVVVTDHLDSSERMLTELANADPKRGLDITGEQKRVEELLASNRIYRQTALQRGDERLVAVLSDLEPVLIEIANSDPKLSPGEVASLQKRIDSKGLLFKVRVVSAQTGGREKPVAERGTNSL
jgi:hypothetical protein